MKAETWPFWPPPLQGEQMHFKVQTQTLEGMVVTEGTAVVGVALGPVDAKTGLITMLVTLG